jgi:hypothetical protein
LTSTDNKIKHSFHPGGRRPTAKAYIGARGIFIGGKGYAQFGTDDFTGDNSTALGLEGTIGVDFSEILKKRKLRNFLDSHPKAKYYLEKLSMLDFGFASSVGIEGLYNHEDGKLYMQIALEVEVSAKAFKDIQRFLSDQGALDPAASPAEFGAQGKYKVIRCAVTVPVSGVSLSDFSAKKGLDLGTALGKSCYYSMVNNLTNVNNHGIIGSSVSPYLRDDWTATVANGFDINTYTKAGILYENTSCISVHDALAITKKNNNTLMSHFPSAGPFYDNKILTFFFWGTSQRCQQLINHDPLPQHAYSGNQ